MQRGDTGDAASKRQTTDAEGAVLIVVNKEQEGAMSPLQSAREEEDKEDYRNTEM